METQISNKVIPSMSIRVVDPRFMLVIIIAADADFDFLQYGAPPWTGDCV
jgi:hypothetical protein